MAGTIRRIGPDERTEGPSTPGMVREEAIATEGLWSGFVRTDPGMASGWHHHGDYESSILVVTGGIRLEFGPDGTQAIDAGPGDFVYVAAHAIHRESDLSNDGSTLVVSRAGSGPPVINVDGPG
jgi:uncharacterized RmlC-like cupin family protein